jgi:hypothetical protein
MTEPDYFPLTPGLALVYDIRDKDGEGTLRIKVLSASDKAGVTKAKCLQTHTVNGADKTTTYTITRKSDGLYGPWGKEFPLPPAPGLTWVRNYNQQCAIDTLDAVVTVPAGTFKGCLRLQWDIDEGEGGNGERCYAPGIGLVYANSSESGDEHEISLRQPPNLQAAEENKAGTEYDPEKELAKGAILTAASYDKTQKVLVTADKVTVGGKPGITKISEIATGEGEGIAGEVDLWLSTFRYKRPDGSTDHVSGLNAPTRLSPGQGSIETAKALADFINASRRPYRATASGDRDSATITIVFAEKQTPFGADPGHISQPSRSQESTSDLFPSDSRFPDNVIENVYMPPDTVTGDIEATAHVLNYITPAGHYCELWWKGLDSGIPILAYLVDENGAHYLPRLSQPKENGEPKYATLEEARDIFTALAKAHYGE